MFNGDSSADTDGLGWIWKLVIVFVLFTLVAGWFVPVLNSQGTEWTINDALSYLNGQGYNVYADINGDWAVSGDATITGDLIAKTGRGATYVIAASDTPEHALNQADIALSAGQDVGATINVAISSGYYNIRLEQGNFLVSTKIETGGYAVNIIGSGMNATVLTLDDGVDDDMFLVGAGASATEPSSLISSMKLDGNSANNASGSGVFMQSGLKNILEKCYITDFKEYGVKITGATASYRPDYATLIGNWIYANTLSGVYIGQWANAVELNTNHISDNSAGSAEMAGVQMVDCVDVTLTGNMLWQNSRANIIIDGAGDISIIGGTLGSATYENIWLKGDGNVVTISGVILTDSSLAGSGLASSILYGDTGEAYTEISITGCSFVDLTGDFKYWIAGTGNGGTGTITGNTFRGTPVTAPFAIDPTSFEIGQNRGTTFKTENTGLATVANGTTSIQVAHGLGMTPTMVLVVPVENPTNPITYWWVSGIDGTNFTINIDADPGASNLDFHWEAMYK